MPHSATSRRFVGPAGWGPAGRADYDATLRNP